MNKKRMKLIIYLTTFNILVSSFKIAFMTFNNKDKKDISNNDIDSSFSSDYNTESPNIILDKENIPKNIDITNETENNTNNIDPITKENNEIDNIETENIEINDCNGIINKDTELFSNNNSDSLKICNVKLNDKVIKLFSNTNGYDLVKINNHLGFIESNYINNLDNNNILEYQYTPYDDIVLTTTDLNFRNEPSITSNIINTFRINTELQVKGRTDNGWLIVSYNGILGYVKEEYTFSLLNKLNSDYPEWNLNELNFKNIVYVTCNELNVRNGTGIDYSIIGKLEKLESVRVIDEIEDWYFVMNNDYTFGYINKNYTNILKDVYVIVDLSEQRLYMYNNNTLICIASITSGKDSTPSDKGLFSIWYKGTNEEIVPNHLVDYWMPYNNSMEGLHDAKRWRNKFGMHTEEEKKLQEYRYNGSNGCINMKLEDAKLVYENVSIGTKVLVHK